MYRREMLNRKMLYCVLVFVFVAVFTMTIAYATLSVTLNIGGAAEIVASNWDIHLENPKVRKGSVSDEVPTITSGNTMNFNVEFDIPGDYYEFTVDVVNDGDIDAMIDNVIKNPELTTEQAKYIKYEITYLNGNNITESQGVPAKSSIPIKVRVEYRDDISSFDDLPSSETTLSLSISLTYIQADETITSVSGGGKVGTNGSLDEIGTIVTIGTEQFYTIGTVGDNVKLLAMYNLYVGGKSNYEDWSPYGDEATGMQDATMLGVYGNAIKTKGVTAYSDNGVSYSGSIVEGYVNNYKTLLESNFDIEVIEARLITKDELLNFSWDEIAGEYITDINTYRANENTYTWLYSSSYWTGSNYGEEYIWEVDTYGDFFPYDYDIPSYIGVRPVIVVPKYAITGEIVPR